MDVINQNSKEVAFKEFKCAYEILNKIKKGSLTVENAEVAIKAFEICYNFILKYLKWEEKRFDLNTYKVMKIYN